MLRLPNTSKRLRMLDDQLGTAQADIASLQLRLTEQTELALATEEKLLAQRGLIDGLIQQAQQLNGQVQALSGSLIEEQGERGRARAHIDQLNSDRETDCRRLAFSLAKLEKRMDQQEADATTTAAILLARLGAADDGL